MAEKTCVVCGNPFESRDRTTTCSSLCRKQHRTDLGWKRYRDSSGYQPEDRICIVCESKFVSGGRGNVDGYERNHLARTCSDACRDSLRETRLKGVVAKEKQAIRLRVVSKKDPHNVWIRQRVKDRLKVAAKKGIPCDSYELLEENLLPLPTHCPVFGIELNYIAGTKGGGFRYNSPSLDKYIPELGYVVGNTRIVSWRYNCLKRDSTPEERRIMHEYDLKLAQRDTHNKDAAE